MERIASLIKPLELRKKGSNSERASIIEFFVDELRNKNGKKFSAKLIAIKLSHLNESDLYYMKSLFNDKLKCTGRDSAGKWFWWSIRKQTVDKYI